MVPERAGSTYPFTGTFLDGPWPLVVGHRGDPSRHPDNTLAGVMAGLEATGAVEVDVRLTQDGQLILSHDATVGGMPIHENSAERLLGVDPRPTLLDEVIAFPGRLNLEVKNIPGDPGFDPEGLVSLLAGSRARPTDLVSSFYWPDMDNLRARDAPFITGLVVGEGGSFADALDHAVEHGHGVVCPQESLITADLCEEAGRLGIGVAAWTVDSPTTAQELSEYGVAAIISDEPLLILNGLRE